MYKKNYKGKIFLDEKKVKNVSVFLPAVTTDVSLYVFLCFWAVIPELLPFEEGSTYSYNAFETLKLHQTSNLLYYKISFGI